MSRPAASASGPEERLILAALRCGEGWEECVREALRADPDWDLVCHAAARHGVLPFLYARLKAAGEDLVAPGAMARMRGIFLANGRRNVALAAALRKVLKELEARGIAAVPFKGPALAEAAYGDIALRRFSDLDILVRARDIRETKELLQALGLRLRYAFTERQEKAHRRRTCEYTFEVQDGGYSVDVHWRLAARYLLAREIGGIWDRVREGRLAGARVPCLGDEDTLLMLCLHGTFHLWSRLGLVCDVARFLEARKELDGPELLRRATAAGLKRMLLAGLSLAGDLLGAPLPAGIGEEAEKDRAVRTLRDQVRSTLFRRSDGEPGFLETGWFQIRATDRFADKARYLMNRSLLPTVEDWNCVRLPDSLYVLYFFLRPVRLLGMGALLSRLNAPRTSPPAPPSSFRVPGTSAALRDGPRRGG